MMTNGEQGDKAAGAAKNFRADPIFLEVGSGRDARRIAMLPCEGEAPLILWLGGFRSDMRGGKAEHLSTVAQSLGVAFCRFDYSGHGESGGRFVDGTLSRWIEEAEAVFGALNPQGIILAGSSMGGWIAIRMAQRLRAAGLGDRLKGLLLLAPAPDFTRRLVEPRLTGEQSRALLDQGFFSVPSGYSPEPTIYTRALFDDGARHLVMDALIETGCPVHILQGMADPDVPYSHALDLVSLMPGDSVVLSLIPGGDHRLSRPSDLSLMETAVRRLVEEAHG